MIENPELWMFWGRKALTALVLPPCGPLLLVILALLVLRRHPRLARWLGWSGVLLQLLLVVPASVQWLAAPLEQVRPPSAAQIAQAQAIVVLGAGRRQFAPEYGPGPTPSPYSLERVRYAAHLARQTRLPILVTGGAPDGGPRPEADLMREVLEREFQVPVRWVESASRDTRENAAFSYALLSGAGIHRILLVTQAAHMARAQAAFEAQGLTVIPAPTGWLNSPAPQTFPYQLLPDPQSIYAGWLVTREGLARRVEDLRH